MVRQAPAWQTTLKKQRNIIMPNPWTGKGNPYNRTEVLERLHDTLSRNEAIIVGGAGTGISAKFIEKAAPTSSSFIVPDVSEWPVMAQLPA